MTCRICGGEIKKGQAKTAGMFSSHEDDFYHKWREDCIAAAREQEFERCCQLLCNLCRDGVPVEECNEVITANGRPFWHLRKDATGVLHTICGAEKLRKAGSS